PPRAVVATVGWRRARTGLSTLPDYGSPDLLARRYRSLASTLDPAARPQGPFLPGFQYGSAPIIVSEFGGVQLAGASGWAYGKVAGPEELIDTYRALVAALMDTGPVEGFAYTQL